MPPENPPTAADLLERIRVLLSVLGRAAAEPPPLALADRLAGCTRRELLEVARLLDLKGRHKLRVVELREQVQHAVAQLAAPEKEEEPEQANVVHKFDLGQTEEAAPPEHIPWGYGYDRVTAMVVDPERLFVYWEVSDESIERARVGLGAGAHDAWLNLRVYDVTGRIFDGTNANSYFDREVARSDRRWFFQIEAPTSSVCVELGMRSREGFFVRIARSGRAELPRAAPVPPGGVEWLTVRTVTEEPGELASGAAPPVAAAEPQPAPDTAEADAAVSYERIDHAETLTTGEWEQLFAADWAEPGDEWIGPVLRTVWESGPFHFPVQSPDLVEQHYDGGTSVTLTSEDGYARVVYGPWQVVIRSPETTLEERRVAVWEVRYTRGTSLPGELGELGELEGTRRLRVGASELAGSEARLRGASELRLRGASERRLRGASELRFRGASERRLRGASERRLRGASERRLVGASERRPGGASEKRPPHAGASGRRQ
jgi:hypothetical protein